RLMDAPDGAVRVMVDEVDLREAQKDVALADLHAHLVADPKRAVEVLACLVDLTLPEENKAEVVLGPRDREPVMQELVNCDRLLCEHTRPRQVAQVLVGDAEVVVHLADAAQILELAGHVDRLGGVLDSLGVAVLADGDGAETAESASFSGSGGAPQ